MSTYGQRAALIQRDDLTPIARLLALRILDMQGLSKGACLLPASALANELGVSERTLKRASSELRKAGLLASGNHSSRRRIVLSTAPDGGDVAGTPGVTEAAPLPVDGGDVAGTPGVTETAPLPVDGGDVAGTPGVTPVARGGDTVGPLGVTSVSPRTRERAREKNERESERDAGGSAPPRDAPLALVHPEPSPAPAKRPPRTKRPAPSSAAWAAYAEAYERRYGVEPVRNARVNAQLAQLVARVGADDAPHVAAWYVEHSEAWYVRRGHDVGSLLRDAESLHAQWRRGRPITNGDAREASRGDEMRAQHRRVSALIDQMEAAK